MSEMPQRCAVPFTGVARLLSLLLLATLLRAAPAHAQFLGDLDSDTRLRGWSGYFAGGNGDPTPDWTNGCG